MKKIEYELIVFIFLMVKLIFINEVWPLSLLILTSLLFFAFFSFACGKLVKLTKGEESKVMTSLVVLFLCSAVPNMVFFPGNFNYPFVAYKNFLFVTCIVLSVFFLDGKESKWRIPFLCLLCAVVDPLFALLFFPTIALILFYRLNSAKDYLNILISSLVALALGFTISFLLGHTAWNLARADWLGLLANAVRVLPLIVFFVFVWTKALQKSQNRHLKFVIILTIFASLFPLSTLFLQNNHTNPLMVAVFSQFVVLVTLLLKDEEFASVFFESASFLREKPLQFFLTLIYLSAFSIHQFNRTIQHWFFTS